MMKKTDKVDCPCMKDVVFEDCLDCCEYFECYDENDKIR